MYTETIDNLANYTIKAYATATNMWAPQILGLAQLVFCTIVAVISAAIVVSVLVLVVFRRQRK